MLEQFSRTAMLIGEESVGKLQNSRVAIFGIGGVGSYVLEALVRAGVGNFDIFDNDKVCPSNINRQLIATTKTLGKYKVDAAEERVLDINPDAKVLKYKMFYTPQTADDIDFSALLRRRRLKAWNRHFRNHGYLCRFL